MIEYGSEYDWQSNSDFLLEQDSGFVKDNWQLYRSGRDAMKALARLVRHRCSRVLLPALCCESMILPFEKNGYKVEFYSLDKNLSADEQALFEKLSDDCILLAFPYFGVQPMSREFIQKARAAFPGIVIAEDRTHDMFSGVNYNFEADVVLSSLRKWAALPDGGVLISRLGRGEGTEDGRFAELRLKAMKEKSLYLQTGEPELKTSFLRGFKTASDILDESGEPVLMGAEAERLLRRIDFEKLMQRRVDNVLQFKALLEPLEKAGRLSFMLRRPEASTAYFPVLLEKRDAVQGAMAARNIYCPVIWPIQEGAEGRCENCTYIADHMLAIPCDQRYNDSDIKFIADVITEILM